MCPALAANNFTRFNYLSQTSALSGFYDARGYQPFVAYCDGPNGAGGHVTRLTDINDKPILNTIDLTGQTETITDRLGNATTYAYDADGNITSMTDALGHTTTYTYDANDNKLTETDANGKTTTYTYDGIGNRLSETDPLGQDGLHLQRPWTGSYCH